jgi:hypothetical protein
LDAPLAGFLAHPPARRRFALVFFRFSAIRMDMLRSSMNRHWSMPH